ncbi:H-2 class II histocompatibility antigen, E-D alpha chain-like [Sceloporus undulatus]|uniref:H-2 class II histocompatibility antigen, E-D alpha chain-like n=1 Tax=Sceloporus undulatus TaxID=8520 RepID=UPI001C4C69F7|nr:H-2 class II histocompatibility antigen, E-D alpha chain-like [Sceloporus undulatus]
MAAGWASQSPSSGAPRPRPGPLGALARPHLLLLLLLLLLASQPSGGALEAQETYVQLDFFQESFPAPGAPEADEGEILHQFQGQEIFHVDWGQRETHWRLPDFPGFSSVEAAGALGSLSVDKSNLEALVALSNRSQGQNVAPSATMYTKDPVALGDPNVLICFVDEFFPPVLNITWLKNGEEVFEGVQETGFYPSADNTLSKFSYLPFIPEDGDFYACQVDHWGLQEPLTKIWYAKEPTPLPETTENVLCGLGLAIGILGIITGTVLFFKAMRMNDRNSRNQGGL